MTTVVLPLQSNGCKQPTFESTYSMHLHGRMTPEEFAGSMSTLNTILYHHHPSVKLLIVSGTFIVMVWFLFGWYTIDEHELSLSLFFLCLIVQYIPFSIQMFFFHKKKKQAFELLDMCIRQQNQMYTNRYLNWIFKRATPWSWNRDAKARIEIEVLHLNQFYPAMPTMTTTSIPYQVPISQVPVSQVPISQVPISQVPSQVPLSQSTLSGYTTFSYPPQQDVELKVLTRSE